MEQASNVSEEIEDADDVLFGEDEISSLLKPQEDDAQQTKPQDEELGQGEEEQRDHDEDVGNAESTMSQDVGPVDIDDVAKSSVPTKPTESGQSESEQTVTVTPLVSDTDAEANTDAEKDSNKLVECSPHPESLNKRGNEQDTLTKTAQESDKVCEEEGRYSSVEQNTGEKGITEEPSATPALVEEEGEEDLGDQELGDGHDRFGKSTTDEQEMDKGEDLEESSEVHMMCEQEETGPSTVAQVAEKGDEGWTEDHAGDDAQIDSQKQPHEDILRETHEPVESNPTRESPSDTEMDTSEADPKGMCPDGDKEVPIGEATVERQGPGGDTIKVDIVTVRGSVTDLNEENERIVDRQMTADIEDGGKEVPVGKTTVELQGAGGDTIKVDIVTVRGSVTDLNEENERIVDLQMTADIEDGGKEGEEGIGDSEVPMTTQEEDALLSEEVKNDSSQPLSQSEESQAAQGSNLSLDEPMDTNEDGEDMEAITRESDVGNEGDAMEGTDQTVSGDGAQSQLGMSADSSVSQEQALSASVSTFTENAMSVAEALVRGSEASNESSVQIKQELLTEVTAEKHSEADEGQLEPVNASESEGISNNPALDKDPDVDVKPSRAELDRVMDPDQSKEASLGETEGTLLQGKPADGKKNNKGSSITSIVGRLFTKKEEEARKRKETSPEEPPEEIANVPFKISGVKSLAAPEQAARQQQRQEMRQTPASPIIIASVTSLAAEIEKCSKCNKQIKHLESAYKWQKELFCSFSCLDTTRITSTKTVTCDSCTVVLHPRIRNVHFAKVGKEMREFCSTRCAKNSEESPKLCPGCMKDVSTSSNPVLAQTGSEGIFFEFCNQDCVNQYEERILNDENKGNEISVMNQITASCTECENVTEIRYEFSFHQVKKLFCSEACFDSFRMKYNTKIDKCATCRCMCYNDTSAAMMIVMDGVTYQFCNEKCKTAFTRPCTYCTTKRCVRMMTTVGVGDKKQYFCSHICRDSHQKKVGGGAGAAPASIYDCLLTNTQPSLPLMTPLTNIHVPSAITGVPQSISSNQQTYTTQQQAPQQVTTSGPQATKCDHCQKVQRPLYHLTMSDRTLRDFCSYNCVISFQSQFNVPPVTLPEETLLLRCHKCQRGFNTRPFVLDYEDKTSLFCSEICLEDYKMTNCIFVQCDQCHQDKILFEKTHFSGEPRTFCSQGCMLLFKQEIVQTLGLQCIVCDYCAQMCKQDVTEIIGGIKRHFCRPECKAKYELWFYKVARCDGCKNTGRQLTEKFTWRGDVKHVCNQQCLLLFYTQQNIPNVTTQLPQPIPSSTAQHATPVIAKVMSLAPMEKLSAPRTIVKENKKSFTNKQTQITTNTVYIKPPPPPPSDLPPPPKMVRNKITSCRPIQITKATMCRPIMKDMCVGTDFPKVPAIVPVPFPVFIPVPMQMYTSHIPHPVAIPIPVPTPMFIPVAARDCDRLLRTIQEIKDRIPSDPLEAELFMMAAAVATDEDDVSDLGTEHDGMGKRGSVSEKEGSITSLGQRTRASLVDQAMVACGMMDEPIDDMGVDELLASLSSPDVSEDILLMTDELEDDEVREKKELLAELSQGLNMLGHIPESAADPPPPIPVTKKVKRITLKKKPKRKKRAMKRKKALAPPPPPAQTSALSSGQPRRSGRAAKRTKYYTDEDSQEDPEEGEEEYEPEVSSSSEEEIIEMVDEVIHPPPAPPPATLPPTDEAWVTAGLMAYKLFVLGLEDEILKPSSQRIKTDVMECSPDVIHRGLIRFIRDALQPNGLPYPPESLLMMCLSIQRHLTDNGRLDNFLAGPNFDVFRDCLHKALAPWTPRVHPVTGLLLNSRINEEMMWASQQLGAHSPHVLLSTIFFFNCRNLRMRSTEEHSKLAFFRMQKLVKKANGPNGKISLLRYFPPKKKNDPESGKKGALLNIGNRKKKEFDPETLDQNENTDNPLRCPVKLYEFYLSKCPESIKMRNEIFYLLPEHSCIPDSPVWYSATKLPDDEMERMLRRYGMVQEVQAGWQEKMKEEEEEERAAELEREKEGGDGGEEAADKAPEEGSSMATEQVADDQTK